MKRIVVETDGSTDAGAAVDSALVLAGGLGAAVTFVCTRIVPSALLGEPYDQRELEAEGKQARKAVAVKTPSGREVKRDHALVDDGAVLSR